MKLLGRKWVPGTRPKFPHHTKEEAEVAWRFINSGVLKGEWWFDVKLPGEKTSWAQKLEEPWRSLAIHLYSKRIDAVCITPRAYHIIEFKKHMLPSGIGQLILYEDMFYDIYKPDRPVHLWYVTYYGDPDVKLRCDKLGIHTWAVLW